MVDGTKRLAWLLATRRLLAPEGAPKRSDFVARLRYAGVKADSSRISRWEAGLDPVTPRLVAAYESATGSPPYSLVAVRHLMLRAGHLEERTDTREDPCPSAPAQFDQIMDRIHSQNMQGDLWLQFAGSLQTFGHVYMHQRVWRATTDLLVDELARSSGLGYLRRYEAAVCLLSVPAVRPHLTRSIGQFTLEPAAQMVVRVLSVLGEDPDGAAHDLLLRMVSTANPNLAGSAALIASGMVGRGFLRTDEDALEIHIGRGLMGEQGQLPAALIDLACRLADTPFQRLLGAVKDPAERQRLHRARVTGELVDNDEARIISDHVSHQAEIGVHRQAHDPDLMLRKLVREALFHVHHDRRDLASTLILTSPYATSAAEAILDLTARENPFLAARAWAASRRLAQVLAPQQLAVRVVGEARRELQQHALYCLAWSQDALTTEVADHTMAVIREGHPGAARAGVTALGMYRRHDLLKSVDRDSESPSAQWWLTMGGAIQET